MKRDWLFFTAVGVALLCSVSAQAQQTGGVRGRVSNASDQSPIDGVFIVATSPALQGEQTAISEPNGSFQISLLPPGTYTLRFEAEGFRIGEMSNVTVEVGSTTPITLDLVPTALEAGETIEVRSSAPAVDQGSNTIGTNLDREFIRSVPSARRYTEVLRETPGASDDTYGTNIFGATGVENQYYVEGLNTTDIGYGRAGANMNTDFFEQIAIETGGYMPEFGRSTGGIFNLVLRSGSNDFHGDVFINYSPGFLRATADPIYRAGEAIGRSDNPLYTIDGGFALGGPIIRDRLWFFVGANPEYSNTDIDRITSTRFDDVTQDPETGMVTSQMPDGMPDVDGNLNARTREVSREELDRRRFTGMFAGKLTLALSDEQRLSLAYFGNPYSQTGVLRSISGFSTSNGISGAPEWYNGERSGGSHNVILNYTGQFLERSLQVEAFAGAHVQFETVENMVDQPLITDAYTRPLADVEPSTACRENDDTPFVDCPVRNFSYGGTGLPYDETLSRFTTGVRLTHLFEGHRVRYGFDVEQKVYDRLIGYSGGYAIDNFQGSIADCGTLPAEEQTNCYQSHSWETYARAPQSGQTDPNFYPDGTFPSTVATRTLSAFLQDSWEINNYVTVNGGLRWDYERMMDGDGEGAVDIPDEFAPRFGVSVDPSGEGKMRFFANYGWFYESVPVDLNVRSFSGEGRAQRYVGDDYPGNPDDFLCFDDEGNYVENGTPGADCTRDPFGVLGGENSPVVRDLNGQYHDETMLGGEVDVADGWVVGMTGIWRRMQRVIEDISPDDGQSYFIANPGENDCDIPEEQRTDSLNEACSVDRNGNGTFEADEYDTSHTVFPNPKREYMGLVLSVRRRLADHVQMMASYTLSRTNGDYPGLFSSDTGQLDPNISAQYDLLSLLPNRNGNLPTDRTHVLKFAGSYELGGLSDALTGLTIGLAYHGESGTPINYLGRHPSYGRQEVFILPRGEAGRTPFIHQFDAFVRYDIPLAQGVALSFNATIFNFLNFQEAESVNQEYTTDVMTPAEAGTSLDNLRNASGMPVNVNPTFGEPTVRQVPLYVRLGAGLSF